MAPAYKSTCNPDPTSKTIDVRMPQVPQALMRRDQALHITPTGSVRRQRTAGQHHLKHAKQFLRHLEIRLVTCMMERNQDLVGKAPAVPRRACSTGFAPAVVFSLAHRCP